MEALGLDTRLLLAQLINYGLFFALFYWLISKPFMAYVQSQRKQDKERKMIAETLEKKQTEMEAEKKAFEQKMKKQYEEELAEAKQSAQKIKDELLAQAHKDADEIVAQAKAQLTTERAELEKEMKDKAIQLSTLLVSKALDDYLTPAAQKEITKSIVERYSKQSMHV